MNTLSENIEDRILIIRDQKVMIDADLAELYGVETKYLNRQVKNNISRFPAEFMFKLSVEEKSELVTNLHRFKPAQTFYNSTVCFYRAWRFNARHRYKQ